jgi:hypothetical protein
VEKRGKIRQATDGHTMRDMHIACYEPKATNSISEYVILIAFPQQQWLFERGSNLHYN